MGGDHCQGDQGALSPAETWARHFPRLKTIVFENGVFLEYQPTRIEAYERRRS